MERQWQTKKLTHGHRDKQSDMHIYTTTDKLQLNIHTNRKTDRKRKNKKR